MTNNSLSSDTDIQNFADRMKSVLINMSSDADLHERFFACFAAELNAAIIDSDVERWYQDNARVSMCHRDTLIALTCIGALSDGAIVEFGPYIGGTTIAMGRGASIVDARVITVEKGGVYDHPVIPSQDILADLKANIANFGLDSTCEVLVGDYSTIAAPLKSALADQKISVFFIDADGHFDLSYEVARDLLAPGALIIIADYLAPLAPEKQTLTQPAVDALVTNGEICEWGLLSGVTWIGQLGGRLALRQTQTAVKTLSAVNPREIEKVTGATGHLSAIALPSKWQHASDDVTDNRSPLLLFEDGILTGPAHSPHALIGEHGAGAYSHWRDKLWFSTRDNKDPKVSGRVFTMMMGDDKMDFDVQANPHFDHDRINWNDEFAGLYAPVPYDEQFDGQWELFLKGKKGFVKHTGVDTSDEYIDDRIQELTGVAYFLHSKKYGGLSPIVRKIDGRARRAERRGIGGRLYLEPKFPIDYFEGKACLDIGCGAGRWTRTLLSLGATVKSVDMSKNGLKSTRRFNDDVEMLNLFDIAEQRPDLHNRFDFTLCWGVVMCTHDPLLAFENVAKTVKTGGDLYIMVYSPSYHGSDYVKNARYHYHRNISSFEDRLSYVYELAGDDKANAINYLDMLNTAYNWTIDEETIKCWAKTFGFSKPHFLNAGEPHKGAHHVLMRKN